MLDNAELHSDNVYEGTVLEFRRHKGDGQDLFVGTGTYGYPALRKRKKRENIITPMSPKGDDAA